MKKIIIIFLLFPLLAFSYKTYQPWYTGPLLAASADDIPKGKYLLQPYLYYIDDFGIYNNSWKSRSMPKINVWESDLFFETGLNSWLDTTVFITGSHRNQKGIDTIGIGDWTVSLGIQFLKHKEETLQPSIRLIVRELFPTGKYQKLNPNKNFLDAFGSGAFDTQVTLVIGKYVYFITNHPICWKINLSYDFPTNVHVKGFNSYGGGFGTRGKVHPGRTFIALFAFEFSFTQRWAYAMDIVYGYKNKSKFRGFAGIDKVGLPAVAGLPISDTVTLSPALEYNFSDDVGIIAGTWFTVAGKNFFEFVSGVISLSYTF